jgi:hypothetical protein
VNSRSRLLIRTLAFLAAPALAAAVFAQAPKTFDPHDLSGKWARTSGNQGFSNVPETGRGNFPAAPFTPAGKAAYELNFPGYGPRADAVRRNDPMGSCDPLGIPRNLNAEVVSSHNWWEIVQLPDRLMQFFEWHHEYRVVYTDGRALPQATSDLDLKWNGYSVGKWEGDTFVVDSVGFDDRTWLDKFGYPHSDRMRLQERYRRTDPTTLELTMVLTDPEYYTRPWESDRKVFRLNALQGERRWDEQIYCVPSEEQRFNRLIRDPASGK